MTNPDTLTRLFWHRGRRQFVDLTVTDAARRLKVTEDQARLTLASLGRKGYANSTWQKVGSENVMIWSATMAGKIIVAVNLDGGIA